MRRGDVIFIGMGDESFKRGRGNRGKIGLKSRQEKHWRTTRTGVSRLAGRERPLAGALLAGGGAIALGQARRQFIFTQQHDHDRLAGIAKGRFAQQDMAWEGHLEIVAAD